jgi:hypothetical protein
MHRCAHLTIKPTAGSSSEGTWLHDQRKTKSADIRRQADPFQTNSGNATEP